MEKFLDKAIYDKAKADADRKFDKNSAYKSLYLVGRYKDLGGRINPKAEKVSGTRKWLNEKWKNATPLALGLESSIKKLPACGTKHPKQGKAPSICRPTKRVDKQTPELLQSYNKKQIEKALSIKKKGKRIDWSEL